MLLRIEECGLPADFARIFPRRQRLMVELGVGSGYFLTDWARQHPNWNILGVEVASASVRRALNRLREAELSNVRLLHGDARFALQSLLPERAIHRLYVNFPDPWPKKKHTSRRLLQTAFLRTAAARLVDGAQLYLTSDQQAYIDWAVNQARRTGLFDVDNVSPPSEVLRTRYARKWQAEDRSIQHAVFTKIGHTHIEPRLTLTPMQHTVLEGSFPELQSFETLVKTLNGTTVVVKRALRPVEGEEALFQVHIEEEYLTQDLLIAARPKADRIVVQPVPFGRPLSTRGVGEAVGLLTEWFEQQGAEVLHRSH